LKVLLSSFKEPSSPKETERQGGRDGGWTWAAYEKRKNMRGSLSLGRPDKN
jgi:hypothetical protein